jgi:hypothetical protein
MSIRHRNTITLICKQCQKPFSLIPSRAFQNGQWRKFCTNKCCTDSQNVPLATRFQWYLSEPTATGCILWTGATCSNGYGRVGAPPGRIPRVLGAHRVAWELAYGPVPDGLHVLHDCPGGTDFALCCNPLHLRLGTHQENMQDKIIKQQQPAGEECNLHKLTEEEVLEIRHLYSTGQYSYNQLARIFKVTFANIAAIVTRRSWKHI